MRNTIGLISTDYTSEDFGSLLNGRTLATLPYGGRYRLLDFPLSSMVNSGITTVGILAPFNYRSLLDHVGVGKAWSLGRKAGGLFILPGSVYGIRNKSAKFLMRDLIQNMLFLRKDSADYVLLCGSNKIYNLDFRPMIAAHEKSKRPITLGYISVPDGFKHKGTFLSLSEEGRVIDITTTEAGPSNYYIDCMLVDRKYLMRFVDWFGALEYMDLLEILTNNIYDLEIGSYEFSGYVGSVDSVKDYMKVSMDLLDGEIFSNLFYKGPRIYTKVQDEAPALYSSSAVVSNSMVSTGCIIEGTVENSILFRNCIVQKGAVVRNSIIMRRTTICEGAELNNVICDKYASFSSGINISGSSENPIIISKGQQL